MGEGGREGRGEGGRDRDRGKEREEEAHTKQVTNKGLTTRKTWDFSTVIWKLEDNRA